MASIGIAYTSSQEETPTAYNFVIDNFADAGMPRSYMGSMSFSNSANGAVILGGPAYREKYQWVISTLMPTVDAQLFDAMFRAWDLDRASGLTAACGLIDDTWGPRVETSAVFVTPPGFEWAGGQLTSVSFGLAEV